MTLKLQINKFEDIHYLSALTQDSLIDRQSFDYSDGHFLIFLNRFKWENYHDQKYRRVHSVIVVDHVAKVFGNNDLSINTDNRFLNLLSITTNYSDQISMLFSEDVCIHVNITKLDIKIKDLHYSWATDNIPYHDIDL